MCNNQVSVTSISITGNILSFCCFSNIHSSIVFLPCYRSLHIICEFTELNTLGAVFYIHTYTYTRTHTDTHAHTLHQNTASLVLGGNTLSFRLQKKQKQKQNKNRILHRCPFTSWLLQLPANANRKAAEFGPSTWVTATHKGVLTRRSF